VTEETTNVLTELSTRLAGAVERAAQSVVRVEARQRMPASGILWSGDGIVVTAEHAVERDENITVGLPDGKEVQASLVGRDPDHDIAVLRLPAGSAVTAASFPQSNVKIGHLALAVARPGGDGVQASWGLVSAVGGPVRTRRGGQLGGYIRTGIAMYPGFSGGALVDSQGQIAGLLSSQLGGDAGMAVPSEVVSGVVQTLVQHGRVRRAFLGFRSQPAPLVAALQEKLSRKQESGLLVVSVEAGSPAEQAGVLIGDVVVSFAGQPVQAPDDLQALLVTTAIGSPVNLGLIRGGAPTELTITPGERQ